MWIIISFLIKQDAKYLVQTPVNYSAIANNNSNLHFLQLQLYDVIRGVFNLTTLNYIRNWIEWFLLLD